RSITARPAARRARARAETAIVCDSRIWATFAERSSGVEAVEDGGVTARVEREMARRYLSRPRKGKCGAGRDAITEGVVEADQRPTNEVETDTQATNDVDADER